MSKAFSQYIFFGFLHKHQNIILKWAKFSHSIFFMVFYINIKTSFSSEQSFLGVFFLVFHINIKISFSSEQSFLRVFLSFSSKTSKHHSRSCKVFSLHFYGFHKHQNIIYKWAKFSQNTFYGFQHKHQNIRCQCGGARCTVT